ncbi:MAG: superoxide dismutase family protein [Chitinophagaceae bacterium]
MKKKNQLSLIAYILLSVSFALFACNNNKEESSTEKTKIEDKTPMTNGEDVMAMATISGTVSDTLVSGSVEFIQHEGKVKMNFKITVAAMANKSVAVHLHEMGDCGDMGKMAHGHWNPTGKDHGKWGTGSFHSGDIGNISLNDKGEGSMELETDLWSIGGDEKTNILNRSLIVHSGTDDYTSQPAGNAGSRIGCGVIMKK